MSFRSGGVRRRVALLTLLVVLVTPAVFGDDIDPNAPPEARIKPPIGSQSASFFDLAGDWVGLYVRLLPLVL